MRRFLFCLSLCTLLHTLFAQGLGTWTPYLSYYNTTQVTEANEVVYALANGSLYSYGKEDQSLKYYSRENGLSDNNIVAIQYNTAAQKLLIAYSNGNLDLLGESSTYNLPYLKNSTNLQDKTVNAICNDQEKAYLAMNFGIIAINVAKDEVAETYRLNQAVRSVARQGETLYAATTNGLLMASTTDNLLDATNWKAYTLQTTLFAPSQIQSIAFFQERLCLFVKGKGIYYEAADHTVKPLCTDASLVGMTLQRDQLLAYTNSHTYICTALDKQTKVATGTTNGIACNNTAGNYWVAAGADGLIGMKLKTNQMEPFAAQLVALQDSPKRNYCDFMTFQQGKLWVAGGGRWTDRYNRPGTLMVNENGQWTNLNESDIAKQSGVRFADVTSIAVDPADPTHYFASTWGEGVFEFKEDAFVKLHNTKNSTLASAITGNSLNYTRVEGLCYDKAGNLWATNTAISSCINVLKADGNWCVLKADDYNVLNDQSVVDKLLITQRGHKWVNILRGTNIGILVFDEKGTIEDTSDDTVNFFSSFPLNRAGGEAIAVSNYFCMAEDKNGQIWMGTNRGPIICPVPDRAITNPDQIYATRLIRTVEGENSYFLDNAKVTAIAVDGGNRKWIGTEGNGVFLVNEDGSETIENFTTENSPLLSDNVLSIAINDATGEVFFGTENGIISYMAGASEGKADYSEVYAYPNPVRPEQADQVTIVGLMSDSNVKITDIAGHLIYQAKSLGGQLTWNCRNYRGERVASGVYLVLAATPEGQESVVTKIMIVK